MRTYRPSHTSPTRRAVLGAGIAAAGSGLLGACSDGGSRDRGSPGAPAADIPGRLVAPNGETRRTPAAPLRKHTFRAVPSQVELGAGRTFSTWTYEGLLPGREVRVTAGDTLALRFANHLPEATTVHWHGIELRNDMDGVPGVTQAPVEPGQTFDYRFTVPHPGTYWFHPHMGVQIDRGMYSPLIVDDPREPLAYDHEWIVVLDDWIDGVDGTTPDDVLRQLRRGKPAMGHGNRPEGPVEAGGGALADSASGGTGDGKGPGRAPSPSPYRGKGPERLMSGATSKLLGGHAGDVAHPYYLINGRTADDPTQFTARPGDRIRLRIINAGGETAFRVALGGHRMTITHSDGFPVRPYRTDALVLGMGERYDALVTAGSGVFPLVALAEGKRGRAMAVLRTGAGAVPEPSAHPEELDREVLVSAHRLRPDDSVALSRRGYDRLLKLKLTGGMKEYDWGIDHRPYDPDTLHRVERGERVRLVVINATHMWHPVHLHGHTYSLAGIDCNGARKDTTILLPHHKLVADFDADNPGLWMLHCHNIYHAESGMMTTLAYHE
ncbi:copper oxidase [Streptomyces cyaneogriseus subsp. noncyanogenus]|uniref:Copper oxidase n=1 Tax=Streptomyces cyaneogriseus subsp. noncyanogenus TaxID=477245 RepID=A0A0C5G3G2_9ACTN|nr:multicopper oxidase family protein [Streptomyces cyaneogriseus]AJP04483.1 copper oxidase [Streptomyces cyaneogriseus subsp. noncyanogenus]